MTVREWYRVPLRWMYQRLTRNDLPEPANVIFVHAGRMERKVYGLELYRRGLAPRLLLSVGRFEISKMRSAGFEGAEELIALRERTAPGERHFFYEMSASGIRIIKVRLRTWDTYGEVLALRECLELDMPEKVLIISTDVHLRRVALVFKKVFGGTTKVEFCPVPGESSSLTKSLWWVTPENRKFVLRESVKLVGYRTVLTVPKALSLLLFQLKETFSFRTRH
jgi:uncharacterized SAM-binding protein YcdF (DUF218 family)